MSLFCSCESNSSALTTEEVLEIAQPISANLARDLEVFRIVKADCFGTRCNQFTTEFNACGYISLYENSLGSSRGAYWYNKDCRLDSFKQAGYITHVKYLNPQLIEIRSFDETIQSRKSTDLIFTKRYSCIEFSDSLYRENDKARNLKELHFPCEESHYGSFDKHSEYFSNGLPQSSTFSDSTGNSFVRYEYHYYDKQASLLDFDKKETPL